MYAVIETGGKQYRVNKGDVVRVELLPDEVGAQVAIDAVNLVASDDAVHVGTPKVEGAVVKATVIEHGRAAKVISFKKKRRKGYRRKIGHRQSFTALKIDEIVVTAPAPAPTPAPAPAKKKTKKKATAKTEAKTEPKAKKKTTTKTEAKTEPKAKKKTKKKASAKTEAKPEPKAKKKTAAKTKAAEPAAESDE